MTSTNNIQSVRQSRFTFKTLRLNRPSSCLLVLSPLVMGLAALAQPQLAKAVVPAQSATPTASLAQATSTVTPVFPANGVYLYGQVAEPDQIGMGYMVFEAVDQKLVGALYMPSSSFDCFQGEVQGSELAMTITNSYSQERYPYSVALATDDAIASASGETIAPLSLEGFQQLPSPSENDLRLLATCKATLQQ